MQQRQIDVAIIGAGTAGLAAYRAARAAGKTALVIEGGPYGTTCARVGCMPSKLLIAAADAAHEARHTAAFGVHIEGQVKIDGRAVMARVKAERDRFVGFVLRSVDGIPAADRVRGFARFIDNTTLQVDEHTRITASRVVIASGSSPVLPVDLLPLGERLVVNDDVFNWDDLPESVAVFGPGVIGLELGQALARLGVRVRVFGVRGGVGPLSDPLVRASARVAFAAEFALDPEARVQRTWREGEHVLIRYLDPQGVAHEESFDYLLAATGRQPNLAGLGLENTSLACNARGVPLYDAATLQCGDAPIFIAGDANHALPLLHEAADEGRIAGENAARYPDVQPGLRSAPLAIVFTDPQLMMVGQRFSDLDPARIVIGSVDFADQGRSRVMLKNLGLLRLYAERETGRVLGAEMVGPRAEHLAHLLAWSIQLRLTVDAMLALPFYHPVVEEGLRTALRDAARQLAV